MFSHSFMEAKIVQGRATEARVPAGHRGLNQLHPPSIPKKTYAPDFNISLPETTQNQMLSPGLHNPDC